MGLQFTSKSIVGADAKLPLALPVKDGFVAAYLTYGDADQLKMNYINAINDAFVFGSPVISEVSALFKGASSYIETPFLDTSGFTFFAVAKPGAIETGKQAMVVGNVSTGITGASLYFTGVNINLSASYESGLKSAARARNENTALYVARCSNSILEIADKTANAVGKSTIAAGEVRQIAGRRNRIGSGHVSPAMNGEANISLVAIYNRTLTDAEVDAVCISIRKLMTSIGITV